MIPIEYTYLALILTGIAVTTASYLHAKNFAKQQRHPRYKGI